jgi:biopolymer transport protein ExbB
VEFLANLVSSFQAGGFWMWVILAVQIGTIYISIERVIALYRKHKIDQSVIAESLEEDIRKGNLQQVFQKARGLENTSPLARTVVAGTQAAMNLGGVDEIRGKMDEVLLKENSNLEKGVPFLASFSNIATLSGLLGTITGMIASFSAVSGSTGAERATLLAAGISEAMYTTAYGLIVAIPGLLMYAVLQDRVGKLQEDLNQGALKVFNLLSYTYNPIAIRPKTKDASAQQLDA